MIIFGMITPMAAVIVLILALIIVGPGKLPDVGKSLGRGLKEFKEATNEAENVADSVKASIDESIPKKNEA